MCMKSFVSSLLFQSKKKTSKDLPGKSTQLCASCSKSVSTIATPVASVGNDSNTSKSNPSPASVVTSVLQLDDDNIVSSTPANATAAFQDLLGINNDPSTDLENTFYQRELPATLVRFSSDKGKSFFRSAMEAGHAEGFFPLTGNFTTQSEPAYCGPSSLAMVLNALEVDPKRRWKGNWRWYSDELLHCCSSQEDMKKNGINFDKFACLAKCHSEVVAKRAPTFSFDDFQKDVVDITSRSDKFLVVSFSRKTLGQTGDGHFSPIGAYNPDSRMVLVLDTARYKYPSYWCPIDTLFESMQPLDKETGRPRGYFLISYDVDNPPVQLCKMNQSLSTQAAATAAAAAETAKVITSTATATVVNTADNEDQEPLKDQTTTSTSSTSQGVTPTILNWSTITQSFCKRIPENMWLEKPRTLEHAIQVVLRNVPPEFTRILASQSMASSEAYSAQHQHEPEQAKVYIRHLLQDTTQSPLYPIVFKTLYPNELPLVSSDNPTNDIQQIDQQAAFATLFLLASPTMIYTSLPRDIQETLTEYRRVECMTEVVKREVNRISQEVKELTKSFCTCGPGWTTGGQHPSCC